MKMLRLKKHLAVYYALKMKVIIFLCKFLSILSTLASISVLPFSLTLFDLLSSGSNRWHSLVWFSLKGDGLSPLYLPLRTKGTFFASPGLQHTPLPIKNQ